MRQRRTWLVVGLGFLVVLAGCSGGANVGGGGADATVRESGSADVALETAQAGDGAGDAAEYETNAATGRLQVVTGTARLEVRDFESASENLTGLVERNGGYVSDTSERVHRAGNTTWKSGRLVLRVPSENFTAVFEAVKAEGQLVAADKRSEDVTGQVVDLRARLESLRAERDQLRELYDRANDTEAVLEVQQRLADVQTEIERTEARLAALENRVNYSTITVELTEDRPDAPVDVEQWYDISPLQAFMESVHGVVVTVRAMVVLASYAAPYLLVFAFPLAFLGAVVVFRERLARLFGVR